MCTPIKSRVSAAISGMSTRKRCATETSASCGQPWNQSNAVQLTRAGNWRARTRNLSPTGEKQSTTCKFLHAREWTACSVRSQTVREESATCTRTAIAGTMTSPAGRYACTCRASACDQCRISIGSEQWSKTCTEHMQGPRSHLGAGMTLSQHRRAIMSHHPTAAAKFAASLHSHPVVTMRR
jgi:hypothetical protein